jgi:hypothetical protein
LQVVLQKIANSPGVMRRIQLANTFSLAMGATIVTILMGGCSRRDYRIAADAQVAAILNEKDAIYPYQLPPGAGVYPDPRARFADPTNPDCPRMPGAVPVLDSYPLPPLVSGDPERRVALESDEDVAATDGSNPAADPANDDADAASEFRIGDQPENVPTGDPLPPSATADAESTADRPAGQGSEGDQLPNPELTADNNDLPLETDNALGADGLRIVPIPAETWELIPDVCLPRMLEFESMRTEYRRTFNRDVPQSLVSDAPRLTLPNVVELALINSREYQTSKEVLYQTALVLTRERYEFDLNPLRRGNGTAANYQTLNVDGTQVSSLAVPTRAGVTKTMATAGQFLATFANDVVLTFDGPQGFSSDIGSELLFDFQQTIFQRDVVFENLTQAERNVVYASRDYIRFRRQVFRDLANRYYNLLLAYRAIEIASQDYFSNLRGYLQGLAEYEFTGGLPRVQVDQFEQNALRSRSDLVGRCNQLETSLDQLKLAMGLPPEMPLNLTLEELETLSASDEWTVARELVGRTRRDLLAQQSRGRFDATGLVNAASVLVNRIEDILRLGQELADTQIETPIDSQQIRDSLTEVDAILAVLESKSRVDALRDRPQSAVNDTEQIVELKAYLQNAELTEAYTLLAARLINLRIMQQPNAADDFAEIRQTIRQLRDESNQLYESYSDLESIEALRQLPELVRNSRQILDRIQQIAEQLADDLLPATSDGYRDLVTDTVQRSLDLADQAISGNDRGLAPIEIEQDPAMLTALFTRLDLMNRRGDLADARRAIKLAGDDLRSILDLRATHIFRTPPNKNRPFSFSFENSQTSLSAALDTPLNRRFERNSYRIALIDYNQSIRALIEAEDQIKFSIRDDLRRLQLRRDQYEISVKSAALAYERVVSTRLQLQLAAGNVVARDFLEAQQAYTAALSSVASQHIAFILDRVELFFDMEAIRLDPVGYWPGLNDEQLQPPIDLNFPANNPYPYGLLPPHLKYSREVKNTVR